MCALYIQAIEHNILIIAGPLILVTPVLLTMIVLARGKRIFINVIIEYYLQTLGIYCQQGLPGKCPSYFFFNYGNDQE